MHLVSNAAQDAVHVALQRLIGITASQSLQLAAGELIDDLRALGIASGDALAGGERGRDVLDADGKAERCEPARGHLRQAVQKPASIAVASRKSSKQVSQQAST